MVRPPAVLGIHHHRLPREAVRAYPSRVNARCEHSPHCKAPAAVDRRWRSGVPLLLGLRPSHDHCFTISPLVTVPDRPNPSDGSQKLMKSKPLPAGPLSHTCNV